MPALLGCRQLELDFLLAGHACLGCLARLAWRAMRLARQAWRLPGSLVACQAGRSCLDARLASLSTFCQAFLLATGSGTEKPAMLSLAKAHLRLGLAFAGFFGAFPLHPVAFRKVSGLPR